MTDWTKPAAYTDKGIAWEWMRERLRGRPITGMWEDEVHLIPPSFSLGGVPMDIVPGSFQPPRIRAEWGGRRSGKAARIMGWDLAKGRDKSATWNGRKWILD